MFAPLLLFWKFFAMNLLMMFCMLLEWHSSPCLPDYVMLSLQSVSSVMKCCSWLIYLCPRNVSIPVILFFSSDILSYPGFILLGRLTMEILQLLFFISNISVFYQYFCLLNFSLISFLIFFLFFFCHVHACMYHMALCVPLGKKGPSACEEDA